MQWQVRAWAGVVVVLWCLVPVPAAASQECGGLVAAFSVLGLPKMWVEDREEDGLWFYMESGAREGRQNGGSIPGIVQDPCGAPEYADTLLAHVPSG